MATRFGRRAADGTFEYHDSRESMIAAEGRENSDARAGLFGLIGLLVGGVLYAVLATLKIQYLGFHPIVPSLLLSLLAFVVGNRFGQPVPPAPVMTTDK